MMAEASSCGHSASIERQVLASMSIILSLLVSRDTSSSAIARWEKGAGAGDGSGSQFQETRRGRYLSGGSSSSAVLL